MLEQKSQSIQNRLIIHEEGKDQRPMMVGNSTSTGKLHSTQERTRITEVGIHAWNVKMYINITAS